MKKHILFFALALQIAFSFSASGQTKATSRAQLAQQFSSYENTDPSLNHHNFFEAMATKMQLSSATQMVLAETVPGENGYSHHKFRQQVNGVPVFGSTYVLHEKNGTVAWAGGHYSPRANSAMKPGISAATALAFAKQKMKAMRYAKVQPQPQLCFIDPAFPKVSETLRLAYQVDLHSTEPFDKRRYFVDAQSGKLLGQFPLVLQEGVPSTAKTRYYGTQQIITDSIGPQQFELHDPTRGGGISVYKPDGGGIFTNNSSNWDLTNAQQDEVALDAHYCSQTYFDLMKTAFDWEGLDGNGKALKVQVHNNGAGPVNAFWDGEYSNYGDGNCNYGPLTTLEVVGHEFTHGMIDHTSKLVYSGESGAINESLADMFGKILERTADPANFSWDLGHSFLLSPEAEPFRVMDDPASVGMPDFYKGALWFDFSDVHTNSSIGNLWFSMLVDGRQGINELGVDYNVPALGIEKTGQIVFLVNRAYLTENSDYNDFYDYSLQAAAEIYGPGSAEQMAVEEAWTAVGLPAVASPVLDLGLSAAYIIESVCGLGEFHPVSFQVVNSGGLPYDPTMGAVVLLYDFDDILPPLEYAIDQPLAPGEVLSVVIDDWFNIPDPTLLFVNVELSFADEDPNNNYSWVALDVVEYEANDLDLNVNFEPTPCFSATNETVFYLNNNSCEALPAGTAVELRAESETGAVLWSLPYIFEEDLEGFSSVSFTEQIALNGLGADDSVRFVLEYAGDPDLGNNERINKPTNVETITNTYENNFNNDQTLDDRTLDILYFFGEPLLNYQGNTFFASRGLFADPETFEHCPDFESNFDNGFFNGVTATMRACVDDSQYQNPYLSFDLALFKNDSAVAEGYPYSSMVQVKWTGTESGSEIIFDQEEGDVNLHFYSLPANFKGEVFFKFYSEIGQWEIDSTNLATDDIVLFDNLSFGSIDPAVEELQDEAITLSPNPTPGSVSIQSAGAMRSLTLHDVGGQLVKQVQVNATTADLDLSGLGAGFYLLHVQLADGQWAVRKVVKTL